MSDETDGRPTWTDMTPRDFDPKAPAGPATEALFLIPDGCGTGDLADLLEP